MSISLSCFATLPKQLEMEATKLREDGKTLEALNLYNQALVGYQKEHQYENILNVLHGRLISWQHLFNHEKSQIYAIFARKEAESMLSIAKEYKILNQDHFIHFQFGKTSIFLNDFNDAELEYKKAVELHPHDNAEKGDWLVHLGEAMYRNGKKGEGVLSILKGINQLQNHKTDLDSFTFNVWVSGAYLRLSSVLISDERKDEAKFYLQQGENIILNDERLVIRKQQLEILWKEHSLL